MARRITTGAVEVQRHVPELRRCHQGRYEPVVERGSSPPGIIYDGLESVPALRFKVHVPGQ